MKLCLFVFLVVLSVWLCCSCATTPVGLSREESFYRGGTNSVAIVERYIAPYVPQPYGVMLEGALAVSTGLLAAWNLHHQKAIKRLENGPRGPISPARPV